MSLSGYQGDVLLNVMAEDGTIQVPHTRTEIGQGVDTRDVQVFDWTEIDKVNVG